MIEKETRFDFECNDCHKTQSEYSSTVFKAIKELRTYGWAVSHDNKKCYCPDCAPFHRNVGAGGAKRKTVQEKFKF